MFDFLEIVFMGVWLLNQVTYLLGLEDPLDVSIHVYNTNLFECKFAG